MTTMTIMSQEEFVKTPWWWPKKMPKSIGEIEVTQRLIDSVSLIRHSLAAYDHVEMRNCGTLAYKVATAVYFEQNKWPAECIQFNQDLIDWAEPAEFSDAMFHWKKEYRV